MAEIESESKFVWKFIWHILLTPITLILMLFGKRDTKDLFRPFSDLFQFIIEPKFTLSIIILNILLYIASLFLSDTLFESLINYPSDIFGIRIYTLITAGFLHADLAHLFGNMLAIFIFGRVVERRCGALKTVFIYFGALLISGIFNSLIYILWLKTNVGGLGASGAVMGLVSAAILLDPFYFSYEAIIPLPIMILGWFTIYADITGILSPISDGIGHFAHIGGFISIGILTYMMGDDDKSKLKKGLIVNVISLIIFFGLYFFFS